jgi:hypothetical protein
MDFFNRYAGAVQAISGLLTVALAAAALIGVKLQIDAADRIQRAQSARDIYREYLAMAINKPEFAKPDYCAIVNTAQQTGYEYFVEYMLYTAEQTISTDPEWSNQFSEAFEDHAEFICNLKNSSHFDEPLASLLQSFKNLRCQAVAPCGT